NAFEGVGEPSVDGGVVYVNRSGHSGISGGTPADLPYLYGLSAATGAQVAQASYQAQWSSHERPVILGGQLVDYNGYYGGMGAWSVPGLGAQWNRSGSIYETPNAAMDATHIYAYGSPTYGSNTQVFSRTNGAVLATLTHPSGMYTYDPIVSGTGKILVSL